MELWGRDEAVMMMIVHGMAFLVFFSSVFLGFGGMYL